MWAGWLGVGWAAGGGWHRDRGECGVGVDADARASIREEVERILGEAAETDAREDEQFGEARGDRCRPS